MIRVNLRENKNLKNLLGITISSQKSQFKNLYKKVKNRPYMPLLSLFCEKNSAVY